MKQQYYILIAFLSIITTIKAQDSLKITHFPSTRPAFTEGALLVPEGKAQIELGASYNYFNGNSHEIQHPNFYIKYGISKYFELRVNGDATTYINGSAHQTGLHPIFIGMKIKMMDAKRYAPAGSFIGGLSANVISTKNFRTKYLAPYFKITMEQFLPKNVGMAYNYGLIWNGENAKPTYNIAIATTYTKLLNCSTKQKQHQFKYFFEIVANYPHGGVFDLRLNNGFAYLLNRYLQLDFSIGAGLLKNSPRFITSAGLAIQFPRKNKSKKGESKH